MRLIAAWKDFADAHLRGTDRSLIDLDDVQHAIAAIQQQHTQVFLFEQCHLGLHKRRGICRGVDGGAFLGWLAQAQSKIQCGFDSYRCRLIDAFDLGQFSRDAPDTNGGCRC
ncbi:MAG: hypothetical protein V9G24_21755 [Rhodoblastus sp.]